MAMFRVSLATFRPILQQFRLLQVAKNLLQKVESGSIFATKSCCAFYRPKGTRFAASVVTPVYDVTPA